MTAEMIGDSTPSPLSPATSWYRIIGWSLFGVLGVGLLKRKKIVEGIMVLVLGFFMLFVVFVGVLQNLFHALDFFNGMPPPGTPRIYGGLIVYGLLALTAIVWEVVLRRRDEDDSEDASTDA